MAVEPTSSTKKGADAVVDDDAKADEKKKVKPQARVAPHTLPICGVV